jgi:transposase
MDTSANVLWAGVDWADEEHQVCVVDTAGKVVEAFAIAHQAEALAGLARRLRALGQVAGVAIETPRHLLVTQLLADGFEVYAVNPSVSHKWCEALSVAGATDDPSQAFALADGLRHHHERLRPLLPDDPATRQLALWCAGECDLIEEQTSLVNKLQALLKEFHPAALEWFEDWTCPSAWDFVVAFPTPQAILGASEKKLYGFLARHHIGASPRWQERIAARTDAPPWPRDPIAETAAPAHVASLVALLRTLQGQLRKFRARIEQLFRDHPDAAIFDSLPGAGRKLAPRLLSHFGTQRERFESARPLQQLSGAAPVTVQSGKHKKVCFRHACQKSFRNALHQFAFCSLRKSEWARASYHRARERGQSHAHALRTVGYQWLKIIYRMWVTRTPYNEAIYLASLIRHRSPLIAWMQSEKNGEKSSKRT